MNRERIAKMTNSVTETITAEEIDNTFIKPVADDQDALAMVEQAIDVMVSAARIIDENLPKIKTDNVPQKAAIDSVKDLMDNAISPYLSDVVIAMKTMGE